MFTLVYINYLFSSIIATYKQQKPLTVDLFSISNMWRNTERIYAQLRMLTTNQQNKHQTAFPSVV